jgi:uncharacterized protein YecE (DUF72 family)
MGELLLGCSRWDYGDTAENGRWTGVFYPDAKTKRLRYCSQFFDTAEIDSTFYEKFYSNMTNWTSIGMSKATPEKFQFSVKVTETITHIKRMRMTGKNSRKGTRTYWIVKLIYLRHHHLLPRLKLQLTMVMTML